MRSRPETPHSDRPRTESSSTAGPRSERPRAGARAARPLRHDRVIVVAASLCGLWIVGFAAATWAMRGNHHAMRALRDAVYFLPVAMAAVLSGAAAWRTRGRQRVFWSLIAVSNLLWTAGEGVWDYTGLVLGHDAAFPSPADIFYLSSYAVVPAAIIAAYGRAGAVLRALLDSSILAVAVGVVGYLLLIRPQLAADFGLDELVGIAYPLLGLVTLTLLLSLGFGGHLRVPRSVLFVALAYTCSALTDAAHTYHAVVHSYMAGSWLNLGWQSEALLLCVAALIAIRHREPDAVKRPHADDGGFAAVIAGCVLAVGLFVMDASHHPIHLLITLVALYSVAALVLRLWLLSRGKDRIARELEQALYEQERLAVSDSLTGLHNRRFFEEVMKLETDRSLRVRRHLGLLVLDLDHFKAINDLHGHPAGDAVLRETARRLAEVARRSDVVARLGGEEFVLVLRELASIEIVEVAERVRRAIGEHPMLLPDGSAISVTVSIGAACLPDHGQTPSELMRAADQALYAAKQQGRNQVRLAGEATLPLGVQAAQGESAFAYLQALVEELETLDGRREHSRAVARWAGLVADELGLAPEQRWRTVAAARFLDLGHVTIPRTVMSKAGSLASREWEQVRRHPAESARLVRLAPGMSEVAAIVADHHERLDGSGYPDAKPGEAIGIEARVVAVCDAWAAMLAQRAHRPAYSIGEARSRLQLAAGAELDPQVVEALLALDACGLQPVPVAAAV